MLVEKLPEVSNRLVREMEVLAGTIAPMDGPGRGNSVLGKGVLCSFPVTISVASEVHQPAVLTALAADPSKLPGKDLLAREFGVTEEVAAAALEILATNLSSVAQASAYRTLLEALVRTYAERLQTVAEHRRALAAEQARCRQILLRAENLERQLLRGSAEVERATDAGNVPTRELAAILDNPQIGVTIEDTNHVVRYENPMLRRDFGNKLGQKCYVAFKGRSEPCDPCPIRQIWEEGKDSVRYTARDPKYQRTFEVIAFPLVGERGEKLIVEVGVEVTALMKQQAKLEQKLERRGTRVAQLHALLVELSAVLQGTCSGVGELVNSADADAIESLRSRSGATGRLAEALSLPLGGGPTDAPRVLQESLDELRSEGSAVPSVRMPVMPDIPASEPLVRALFRGLVSHLLTVMQEPYSDLDFSHTMSGSSEAIAPGDTYHLLFLGPRRPSAEFAEDEVSTLPALGGEAEIIGTAPDVHLAQASLVARKLGGTLWRQLYGDQTTTYFLSLPVEPAE